MSNLKVNKIPSTYEFWGVKGIERLSINLDPNSKINVFIGNNGVGKTKALECLYQSLLFSNEQYFLKNSIFNEIKSKLVFENAKIDNLSFWKDESHNSIPHNEFDKINKIVSFPIVYIPAQERGYINDKEIKSIKPLGEYQERKREYFENIYENMNKFYNTSITEWFIQRALSTNKYRDDTDSREIELLSVLNILNKIDNRISNDNTAFSIPGGNSVVFTIDGQKRNLKELSTGFTSLIRIIQSIVSGYSFFTNSTDIENEMGVVLIDEIESHLHISWQTKILPTLNKIFPNTIFIVATHSSLVLSQLYNGKAYQLVNDNGIVKNKEIPSPSNEAFVDLLSTAFNVNLNKIKLDNIQSERSEKQQNNLFDTLGITN